MLYLDIFQQLNSDVECKDHYRSSQLDNWTDINEAAMVLVKNKTIVKSITFDARHSTAGNWFDKDNVLTSSWGDVKGK